MASPRSPSRPLCPRHLGLLAHRALFLVPVLVLLPCLAPALPAAPQQDALSRQRWLYALDAAEDHLAADRWAEAESSVNDVFLEMCSRITGGDAGSDLVGVALYLRAAARAGRAAQEEGPPGKWRSAAVWDWWIAQNLAPVLRTAPLPALGPASDLLHRHRLRSAGELPTEVEVPAPLRPDHPASPLYVPLPAMQLSFGDRDVSWPDVDLPVELMVDAEGRVRQPVVLGGDVPPGVAVGALYALRNWRFRPAHAAGRPVVSLVTVRVPSGDDSPAFRKARHPPLSRLRHLLIEGRWEEANSQVRRGERSREACLRGIAPCEVEVIHPWFAEALVLGAVAAAAMGNGDLAEWRWSRALNLAPHLADAYVELHGEPGRVVAALRPRCTFGRRNGCRALEPPVPGLEPPRPLHAPPLAPPPDAGWIRRVGSPTVRLVVDAAGRVREPRVLSGGGVRLRDLALDTVRAWRFEPARLSGEPVAVVWEVSVPIRGVEDTAPERSEALVRRAVAAAGDGRREDALWHWWSAQNLRFELRRSELSAFGEAGRLLATERLRVPASGLEPECPAASADAVPALLSAQPARLAEEPFPEPLEIEILVGPDGAPRRPVVLTAALPEVVLHRLEALRGWRFESPGEGKAPCVRVWMPGGTELSLDEIGKEARKLARRALDEAAGTSLAALERARALWRHAARRDPRLHRVELPHHGAAGVRLQTALRRPAGDELRDLSGELLYPVKLHAPAVQFTREARQARLHGVLVVRTLVGRDGSVQKVEVLRGLPLGMNEQTIRTMSRWRFLPALMDGEPVAMHYNLTHNFMIVP